MSRSGGADNLAPQFLKSAADFISPLRKHISLICLLPLMKFLIAEPAFVLPLLKAGDPTLLNDCRPDSNQSWQRFKELLTSNHFLIYFIFFAEQYFI